MHCFSLLLDLSSKMFGYKVRLHSFLSSLGFQCPGLLPTAEEVGRLTHSKPVIQGPAGTPLHPPELSVCFWQDLHHYTIIEYYHQLAIFNTFYVELRNEFRIFTV